jgi:hypothetical protein
LRSLGWQLSRIWSTDYWHDPVRELDRIEGEIELARTALREIETARIESSVAPPVIEVLAEQAEAPEVEGDPASEESAKDSASGDEVVERPGDPDGPRPYVPANLHGLDSDKQMATSVLAAEAPIAFGRLVRTLAAKWDVSRVTDRFRERVRSALPPATVEDDGVLWNAADQRGGFRGFRVPRNEQEERAIDELPIVEVVSAMVWLLRQHHALASDDLAREAARCFGIQRLGSVVRQVMGRALERLQETGQCERDGETVRWRS